VEYTGTETDVRMCSTSPLADAIRNGTPILGTGVPNPFEFFSSDHDENDPGSDWLATPC
jgi:hypothetical protein